MKSILIKGGTVIDPSQKINKKLDILIEGNIIKELSENIKGNFDQIINVEHLYISPGFIDIHVHLRDPGLTYKEDIISGCNSASAGGITSLLPMPNSLPPCDNPKTVEYIIQKAKSATARVFPVGCITQNLGGKELTNFDELKKAGAITFSDDGRPVFNIDLMEKALKITKKYNIPITSHCEDLTIVRKGIINNGEISKLLNLQGMDRTSEDSVTQREINLADKLDSMIHIAHVSTEGSKKIIEIAKNKGVKVTAETCPHYFILTDKELLKKDANYRMNPPLREEKDRLSIIQGIKDGTFDCIVTDHAPHSIKEKENFETAPNGIIGLESSFALSYTYLVQPKHISLYKLVELMSTNPAKIMKLPVGTLKKGSLADIAIFDINKTWIFNKNKLKSKSKNTPFDGYSLSAKVLYTIMDGNIVYQNSHSGEGE